MRDFMPLALLFALGHVFGFAFLHVLFFHECPPSFTLSNTCSNMNDLSLVQLSLFIFCIYQCSLSFAVFHPFILYDDPSLLTMLFYAIILFLSFAVYHVNHISCFAF